MQLASSSRNHGAAAEADAIREHAAAEADAIREHAAAEADAIGEQQLKRTQLGSSSSAQRAVRSHIGERLGGGSS